MLFYPPLAGNLWVGEAHAGKTIYHKLCQHIICVLLEKSWRFMWFKISGSTSTLMHLAALCTATSTSPLLRVKAMPRRRCKGLILMIFLDEKRNACIRKYTILVALAHLKIGHSLLGVGYSVVLLQPNGRRTGNI